MCGIAGIVNASDRPADRILIGRMIETLRHRGPDASGIWIADHGAGLGHARLSIIDLATGNQPMLSADGSLAIVFNGEIFNYLELRAELVRKGRRFATGSDTEVILQMYEEEGEACVARFNGDWAFAIWDSRRRRLFLSRDRAGVRPLFYATTPGGSLVFGSEVKAVLCHPEIERSIDIEALDQVFTFWCTLAPKTLFTGVHELPPGHNMVFEAGRTRIWPYWQVAFDDTGARIDEKESAGELLELLTDATRLRLRSDVPVGAYLSGGLDSSVTTALVNHISGDRLRSFSVRFDDLEFDEGAWQGEVVQHLGTEHQSIGCSYDDIARVLPEVVRHAEKPILRTAPAPLFLLSQLVRDAGYKVVLTGEGADEFLGGYDIFKEAKIRRFWARAPQSRCRPLLLERPYPYMKNLHAQPEAWRRRFFRVDAADLDSPFFSHLPRWELTSWSKLFFSDELKSRLAAHDVQREARELLPRAYAGWDGMSQAQYLEATMLLPGYILSSQGDRMSMAHSVEGRFPFLDHRVIEFAVRLPPQLRMKALNEKYLLKRAAGHLVPESVSKRPKQPYRAPDAHSLFDPQSGRARCDFIDDLLSPSRLRNSGLFDAVAVGKLAEKARTGKVIGARDNMALVGILSTQLLIHQFIDTR